MIRPILLCLAGLGWAAISLPAQQQWGISAGFASAKLLNSTASDALTGYCFSGHYLTPLSQGVDLQFDFRFVQKGGRFDEVAFVSSPVLFVTADVEGEISVHQIELQGAAVFRIPKERRTYYYLLAGNHLGFATGGHIKAKVITSNASGGSKVFNVDEPLDFSESDYNRIEIGLALGSGVNFQLGEISLRFGMNANLGLSNLDRSGKEQVRNWVIAFQLGFLFPAKSKAASKN